MTKRIPKPHLKLDSYKVGHFAQYPKGTSLVYSNLTARSATHASMPASFDNKVVFFGLQGFILEHLIQEWNEGFFNRPKDIVLAEYKRRIDNFLGVDAITIDHIAALHDLGYLPLCIKALPEGSRVDIKVPFLTVYNTLPAFFWLTNYIETTLSNELWKQCTVATITYEYRRILNKYVELTGAPVEFADWQIHDFSMRGMSGSEDAGKCGAAHLLSSFGTDTLPAIDYLEDLYGADVTKELVAGSVPATEHSVMCMGGNGIVVPTVASFTDGNGNHVVIELDTEELQTFHRLIAEVYPAGIVSIVSDTWDFWKVITQYAKTLAPVILNRAENALGQAKVVFRPDSGDPVKIITGLKYVELDKLEGYKEAVLKAFDADAEAVKYKGKFYEFDEDSLGTKIILGREVPEHEVKGAVECLYDIFGGTETDKGYKTLNQRVGLIYGDSITLARCEAILQRLMDKGYSAANIVFGVGSYTYQYMTRDTFGMAVKATYGIVNGEGRELFKDPATGDGIKKSAKGLLRVEKEDGKFVLYDQQSEEEEAGGALETVFYNSMLVKQTTLAEVRKLLAS